MGRGQASSFGGRHEKCIRNMLGTPIKSRARMQVGEAVQGRDRDRRGNCGEKPPNWRMLKRVLGQNRACRWCFFFNSVCLLLSSPFSEMRNHTTPRGCWALSFSSILEAPLVCGELARWLQTSPGGFRHPPLLVLVYLGRHLHTQWSKQTSGDHRVQLLPQSQQLPAAPGLVSCGFV